MQAYHNQHHVSIACALGSAKICHLVHLGQPLQIDRLNSVTLTWPRLHACRWDAQAVIPIWGLLLGAACTAAGLAASVVSQHLTSGTLLVHCCLPLPEHHGEYSTALRRNGLNAFKKKYELNGTFMCSHALFANKRPRHWFKPGHWPQAAHCLMCCVDGGGRLGDAEQAHIESLLALGATRFEVGRSVVQSSLRVALMPAVSQLNVVGLVNIPVRTSTR